MSEDLIAGLAFLGGAVVFVILGILYDTGIFDAIAERIRRGGDKP